MSSITKEKIYGQVIKPKEEYEKEINKKTLVYSMIIFSAMGLTLLGQLIMNEVKRFGYFINGFIAMIIWAMLIFEVVLIIYLFSKITTKKYNLKEIKQ